MAPEAAVAKRKPRENQYLFEVGVRGRKTGLTVPDTGIRDENGLEPMDHLFSSPEKPKQKSVQRVTAVTKSANATISSEEDMDMDENTIPEPTTVLNERKQANMRLPPPRSKSPIKTFLQSPARRHPSLGPGSSPSRPTARASSVSASVRRRLDFGNASFSSIDENTIPSQPLQKRAGSAVPRLNGKLVNGNGATLGQTSSDHDVEQTNGDDSTNGGDFGNGYDDSLQMVNGDSEIMAEPEPEADEDVESVPEDVPVLESKASKKDKGKTKAVEVPEKVAKRGRPKKVVVPDVEEEIAQPDEEPEEEVVEEKQPKKRTRASLDGSSSDAINATKSKSRRPTKITRAEEEVGEQVEQQPVKKKGGRPKKVVQEEEPVETVENEPEEVEERPKKRSRQSIDGPSNTKVEGKSKKADSKPKATGRKTKLATIEEDSPVVHRGPPLPRTNTGLFILRRETPFDGAGFKQTRSGRHSIKPVAFWKNERIEYDEDEMDDAFGKYMLPRIKEVVRAEEVEQPKRPRGGQRSKSKKPRKATAEPESEDDDEVEPWETEPGRVYGAIRAWDPEDPTGAEVDELEEELALSSEAIQTGDIVGATFKFAKTLSYDFFGAGMVDLPPGGQKKPKNSRRMQLAFFVFYGRVKVTINDTEFRIGKGGMFQVPRGNSYSLENDYDKPARIFFSQGCELPEAGESQ